eukprot:COSAG01_NODE_6803_length_3493_cov_2.188273_1_plen_114_part_00
MLEYNMLYADVWMRRQGVQTMLQIAGTALGPLALGVGHAWFGEYSTVLRGLCVLPLTLGTLALLALRMPAHPEEDDDHRRGVDYRVIDCHAEEEEEEGEVHAIIKKSDSVYAQ